MDAWFWIIATFVGGLLVGGMVESAIGKRSGSFLLGVVATILAFIGLS